MLELTVWPTAPPSLSLHKLLATRDCVYQYRFSENRHVLIWPAAQIQPDWCHHVVALNHRRLKNEACTLHQAMIALALMDSRVISDELIESCRMQSQEIVFVKRMREVVYG